MILIHLAQFHSDRMGVGMVRQDLWPMGLDLSELTINHKAKKNPTNFLVGFMLISEQLLATKFEDDRHHHSHFHSSS